MGENKKNIAYFSRRFIGRFFDLILTFSFILLLFFLFFLDLDQKGINIAINSENWVGTYIFSTKILFLSIISFLINFIYFIIIPYFWKGYTIFRRILKIKYYIYSDENKIMNLFKGEIFIWVIPILAFFLFSLISFSVTNSLVLCYFLNPFNNSSKLTTIFSNPAYVIISNIFIIIFSFSFLPSLIVLLWSFIKSGKVTINDNFAGIYCISTLDVKLDHNEKNKGFNNNVPGILDESEIDKITGEKNE